MEKKQENEKKISDRNYPKKRRRSANYGKNIFKIYNKKQIEERLNVNKSIDKRLRFKRKKAGPFSGKTQILPGLSIRNSK